MLRCVATKEKLKPVPSLKKGLIAYLFVFKGKYNKLCVYLLKVLKTYLAFAVYSGCPKGEIVNAEK